MKMQVPFVAVLLLSATHLFAGQENWQTDFAKAKQDAADRQVPILADFAGSDWCGWCMKLDQEVFSQTAFKTYASTNLVLFLADFPQSKTQSAAIKKQNSSLAEQFGIEGFPTVLLLDSSGKVLGRSGYLEGGASSYVEQINKMLKQPQTTNRR